MDVVIEEMESVVHVSDRQSMVDPQMMEQIVKHVMARLKEAGASEKLSDRDREYKGSVTGGK